MSLYPPDWPACPSCGKPALDGHVTCGQATCNESAERTKRNNERMRELGRKIEQEHPWGYRSEDKEP